MSGNPVMVPDRELEEDKEPGAPGTIGSAHPLPGLRLVAPQGRQVVL
jgi:hypothetical protein